MCYVLLEKLFHCSLYDLIFNILHYYIQFQLYKSTIFVHQHWTTELLARLYIRSASEQDVQKYYHDNLFSVFIDLSNNHDIECHNIVTAFK